MDCFCFIFFFFLFCALPNAIFWIKLEVYWDKCSKLKEEEDKKDEKVKEEEKREEYVGGEKEEMVAVDHKLPHARSSKECRRWHTLR